MHAPPFNSTRRLLLMALTAVMLPLPAAAYPDKPITLVIPFPPGAVTDRIGRALALELGKRLGQQVIVENVGGASGTLAGRKVLRAPPDGYTLLMGTVNDMVVAPIAVKAGYSVKDFTPIAKVGAATTVLVAHPSLPADTMDEFVAYARQAAAPVPLGATGVATLQTLGGVMLADAAGFKFNVVPYKGGGPLLTDLVAGQVHVATMALPSALPLVRDGKLKSLGILSLQRDPAAPHLPTVNEGKSVKGIEADLWLGLAGPPSLPPPVLARLSAAMRDVLADTVFRETEFKAGSVLADYADPAAFKSFVVREEARLRPLATNVKGE